MRYLFKIFTIFIFILNIISCGENEESTTIDDTTSTAKQMGGSFQGIELSLSNLVTTLAGTGSSGSSNGTGTAASFNQPNGITTDGTNLYVADRENNLIRKIE